jgi:VCBS repeat-containing protein
MKRTLNHLLSAVDPILGGQRPRKPHSKLRRCLLFIEELERRELLNQAPIGNPDSFSTDQDVQLTVIAPGVLGNDTDADNDTLTAVVAANSNPAHGSLSLNSNGAFVYTPDMGFVGSDSFSYQAFDGTAYSTVALVTIAVGQGGEQTQDAYQAYSQAVDEANAVY